MAGSATTEEWQRKGATLSDKNAGEAFGLSREEIVRAIRAGELQHRVGSMFGNPFLRLLRREVEALVARKRGDAYVRDQEANRELLGIDREIRGLRRKMSALEERRAALVASGRGKKEAARRSGRSPKR